MTDWGAINDRVQGIRTGLELEMLASGGESDARIVAAVKNGTPDESLLDQAVERILNIIFSYADHRHPEANKSPPSCMAWGFFYARLGGYEGRMEEGDK